jgi:CheY-like chemotaxis protein
MTRTILLADDSVTIQKVVELTFMDEDFRVVPVGNGTEAIERLGELRPDFVIADVHMPGADGYEVSQQTRETLPSTPVLLLVGTFESFDAERAAQVGASGHLKKPFDSQELLRRVKELLQSPAAALPRATAAAAPMPASMPLAEEELLVPIEESGWTPEPPLEPAATRAWHEAAPVATSSDWSLEAPAETDAGVWSLEPEAPAAATTPAPVRAGLADAPALASTNGLSEADVDRVARRIIELLGDQVVRDVAWEVVPDLAEVLLKARIRELESAVD